LKFQALRAGHAPLKSLKGGLVFAAERRPEGGNQFEIGEI